MSLEYFTGGWGPFSIILSWTETPSWKHSADFFHCHKHIIDLLNFPGHFTRFEIDAITNNHLLISVKIKLIPVQNCEISPSFQIRATGKIKYPIVFPFTAFPILVWRKGALPLPVNKPFGQIPKVFVLTSIICPTNFVMFTPH